MYGTRGTADFRIVMKDLCEFASGNNHNPCCTWEWLVDKVFDRSSISDNVGVELEETRVHTLSGISWASSCKVGAPILVAIS